MLILLCKYGPTTKSSIMFFCNTYFEYSKYAPWGKISVYRSTFFLFVSVGVLQETNSTITMTMVLLVYEKRTNCMTNSLGFLRIPCFLDSLKSIWPTLAVSHVLKPVSSTFSNQVCKSMNYGQGMSI